MKYAFYIDTAYGVTAVAIIVTIVWIWIEGRIRQKQLAALEKAGHGRRSARPPQELER
ncbi:heme exporter protein CcmD [Allorhizobium sp. BGMRC 0089]|uniref:heme exporter protein CcmD n=1 Tax=Allorhizobium sonneratiae TaxID=2934936 RepID=UPI00203360B7|nr:heme exporter protein CcmD [Allorhizobium sonneratiae]MCM2293361.1 heme exporter protein CcmD [Allorhizobium sonneratiae]